MAFRIFRRLTDLLDVDTTGVADGDSLTYDSGSSIWIPGAGGGGGVTDHGALTGLADDDHTQYLHKAPATIARNRVAPTGGIATGNRVLLDSTDAYADALETGAAFPWLVSSALVGRLTKALTANAATSTHGAGVLGFISSADAFRRGHMAGVEGLAFYTGSYSAGNAAHEIDGVMGWSQDIDQDYAVASTAQLNHLRGGSFEVTRGGSGLANDATAIFARVIVDGQTFTNLGETGRITGFELDQTVYGDAGNAQHLALYGIYMINTYDGPQNILTATGIRIGTNYGNAGIVTSYGIRLAAQSGATTSYAIYSEGGNSVHVGPWLLGLAGAPADAVFANSQGAWYAVAADALPKWKGKTSGGVVVNFTPAQASDITSAISTHEADTTSVHGITDTSTLYRSGGTDVAVADGGTGASTASAARTNLGLVIGTDVEAKDATLTALAAANWAANAVPIGSGADTLAQTTFAASTFPARASTGNLVAKTITDFALTVLDDTDAATARATLGVPTGDDILDNGQSGIVAPTSRGWTDASQAFVANRCTGSRFVLLADKTITALSFYVTVVGTGNIDVAILSGSGARLASSGSTAAKKGTLGLTSVNLSGSIALTAGTVYYAVVVSDVSDGSRLTANWASNLNKLFGAGLGPSEAFFRDSSFPVPSDCSSGVTTAAVSLMVV